MKNKISIDKMLKKAKESKDGKKCGMFLFHDGVVRESAKAKVRFAKRNTKKVVAMDFCYDEKKVKVAIKNTLKMTGIYYADVWLNSGKLRVSDDIMYVLIGGDIRPHVIDALNYLVGFIKDKCVNEVEIYE